jgi:adenylate cyclase
MSFPHHAGSLARPQSLRLASGLILFTFVTAHLVNHAAGLISVAAMNLLQDWRLAVTQSLPGTVLLLAALLVHPALALIKLAQRTTLRMPAWEALQLLSGLLIPLLLIPHVAGATYLGRIIGSDYSYTSMIHRIWPAAATQTLLVLVVWTHGCMGLHFWLRPRPGYGRHTPMLLAAAVALPLMALAGFLAAARELQPVWTNPDALAETSARLGWPNSAAVAAKDRISELAIRLFAASVATALIIFAARGYARRAAPSVRISFAGGPTVSGALGSTLLDISRRHDIPHVSVCGGRARCSTCRVRVDHGAEQQPPPGLVEALMLRQIKAPPNVRLACQLRPAANLSVTRLIRPQPVPLPARSIARMVADTTAQGVEQEVSILFLDIRGFTELAENRLAFDVVFLLNQFFNAAGDAIYAQGGWIDKYMGDGLMAVFGRDSGPAEGARQALQAARAIDLALEALNNRLRIELAGGLQIGNGLQIGIGIHAGPVIIGRIGHSDNAAVTVIGSTVNAASRLEALTKDRRCQLIVSAAVTRLAGLVPVSEYDAPVAVRVRGLSEPLDVWLINRARDVPVSFRSALTPAFSMGAGSRTLSAPPVAQT